jgi:hypothetical protein
MANPNTETNMTTTEIKGANLATRRELPTDVTKRMRSWRDGLSGMPVAYIDFHKAIAQDVLAALVAKYGIRVVETTERDAGWFDGMREVNAIVEDRKGRVHRLVYCDSNQGFMVRCASGGQASFSPEKLFL